MARESHRSPSAPGPQHPYDRPDLRYTPPPSYSSNNAQPPIPEYDRTRPSGMTAGRSEAHNRDAGRSEAVQQPIDDAVNSAVRGTDQLPALSPELLSQITAHVLQQLKNGNPPAPDSMPPPPKPDAGYASPGANTSPVLETRSDFTPESPGRSVDGNLQPPLSPPARTSQPRLSPPSAARTATPPEQRAATPTSHASQSEDYEEADDKYRPTGPRRLSTGQDPTLLEKIWGELFDEGGHPTPRLGQFLRGIAVHLIEDYEPAHSLVITPDKMQKYYEDTKSPREIYPWDIIFDDHTSSISRLFREVEVQHHLIQGPKLDERPDIPGLTPRGFERWVTLMLRAHPEQEFERLRRTTQDMPISNPEDRKERFPKEISRRLFPVHPDLAIREKLEKAMETHCSISLPGKRPSLSDTHHEPQPPPLPPPQPPLQPQHSPYLPPQPSPQPQHSPYLPPQSQPAPAPGNHQAPSAQPVPPAPRRHSSRDDFLSPVTSRTGETPFADRQRHSYSKPPSNPSSEVAIDEEHDDEEDNSTPTPIERERQPYVAQPGGGRNYEDLNRPPSPEHPPVTTTGRPERERQPYVVQPGGGRNYEDLNRLPSPEHPPVTTAGRPERERQPYVAQPGGGRNYEDLNRLPSPEHPPVTTTGRPARSGSVISGRGSDVPRSKPIPISLHQQASATPVDSLQLPESPTISHHRSNSTYHQQAPSYYRAHSPSTSANGRSFGHTSEDASFGSSHRSNTSAEATEEARRYRDYERKRERYASDRYDAGRMKAYDPKERERERESRSRIQSSLGADLVDNNYRNHQSPGGAGGGGGGDGYGGHYPRARIDNRT